MLELVNAAKKQSCNVATAAATPFLILAANFVVYLHTHRGEMRLNSAIVSYVDQTSEQNHHILAFGASVGASKIYAVN